MSAELSLRKAMVAALRPVAPGARVYDEAPQEVAFPFVLFGQVQALDDGTGCAEEALELVVDVHVYSRAQGSTEAHTVASAVRAALHDRRLFLTGGWSMNTMHVQETRTMREPDGKTTHSILTVRALVDPV